MPNPSLVDEKKLPHLAENKTTSTNISVTETVPKKEDTPTSPTHTITSTIKTALSHLTGKNNSTLTVEQVKEKWKIFIDKLSEASHSLTFVVRMCTIVKIDENGLNVEVPYIFHKEKLTDFKNKKLFEQAFLDTYGESLPIVCDVVAAPNEEEVKNTNLADIAQQFGGEILAS
jgi:hypothetical protein